MKYLYLLICAIFSFSISAQQLLSPARVQLETVSVGDFIRPVDVVNGGDERLFVVEQRGIISVMDTAGNVNAVPFLDMESKVQDSGNEQGLLGLAFSSDYATDSSFYVYYTRIGGDTRISRFKVSAADADIANDLSEEPLLDLNEPYSNHNGGCLRFAPDGFLYIGTGDGGWFGDPGNRAQDPLNLHGKMLRIDVSAGGAYAIPSDNPFVGTPDTLDEIWQLGLRNPWKFSFDPLNGDMWIGDVGQDDWEEIDYQPGSSAGGENWGWRCYEGDDTYNVSGCSAASAYDDPVFVYDHFSGGFSVTGGYVYRGESQHGLTGRYLFADYVTGNDWTSWIDNCTGEIKTDAVPGSGQTDISTYGVDVYGEMYAANLANGRIYRITEECSTNPAPTVSWTDEGMILQLFTDSVGGATYQWYEECVALAGETAHELTEVEISTPYFVEVTYSDGCIFRSAEISLEEPVVGIADSPFETLTISPNPASAYIVLNFENSQFEKITCVLFDALGKQVRHAELETGLSSIQIQTADLTEGMYFLEISADTKRHVAPIVIAH